MEKAQEATKLQPKQRTAAAPKGKWASGPPKDAQNAHESQALKKEVEKLKAQLRELQPEKEKPDSSAAAKKEDQGA